MPTQKAAFRALRKSKKNAIKNKNVIENIRYLLKQGEKLLIQKNLDKAKELGENCIKAIDKAAQRHIIKKNAANRMKSRLMKKLHKAVAVK